MPTPTGGPAFPASIGDTAIEGMTLLDWFAGQALATTNWKVDLEEMKVSERNQHRELIAGQCYAMARAMVEIHARIVQGLR